MGQMFSAHEMAGRRRIAAAVRGELPTTALNSEEQLVVNLEIDVAIRKRAKSASFGQALLRAGLMAVAVDDGGSLIEFAPDGS